MHNPFVTRKQQRDFSSLWRDGFSKMTAKQKQVLYRIIAAMILLVAVAIFCASIETNLYVQAALYLIPYLIIGYDILKKAARGILNRQMFDENFLMAVATVGAMLLGDFKESVAVMLFYQIGELFQSYAVGKSRRNISDLMDIRPDLMPDAATYMHIVGGFGFFQAVSFTISAVLRAANKPNYAMQVTLLINVLNVFGNYALIFGHFGFPALGVQGAAISTSVCRGVAMTLLFIMLFKRLVPRIPLAYFRPFPFQKLRDVLKIGLPSAAEQISYDASQVTIVYFINMLGNEYLTARVYVMNIVIIGYIFSLSIAQATSICTGNLVGARKKQAAYLLSWYAWRRSLLITLVASTGVYLLGRPLLGIFTENQAIITIAMGALLVDVLLEQGRATVLLFLFCLRSVGDVVVPVIIELFCMWFFAVFCGYMFGIVFGLGLAGMWFAFALDECSRGAVLCLRWRTQKWKKRMLIKNPVNIS